MQGLPNGIEGRDRIRACPPPIGRGGTEGVCQRGQDWMLARVLAIKQGAEEVSVHTSTTERKGSSATRQG